MSLIIKISLFFKDKSQRKRNFIVCHFLVESKPHERIDLLIAANMNVYQTKKRTKSISIVIKTCFSEEKLIKQFGNLLFLKELPFQLIPLILSNFSMTSYPLCPNFKNKPPLPTPNFRGRTMALLNQCYLTPKKLVCKTQFYIKHASDLNES